MKTKEPVRVAVIFGPGQNIKPVWFDWKSRKHAVTETTYRWSDIKGCSKRLHFAVKDENGLYQLTYDTENQTWELAGLECE